MQQAARVPHLHVRAPVCVCSVGNIAAVVVGWWRGELNAPTAINLQRAVVLARAFTVHIRKALACHALHMRGIYVYNVM